MPNRTIYVADTDMPVFERAQELAGDNLSATIAQALRRFVEAEEARSKSFEEITIKVGKTVLSYKSFWGRLLATGPRGVQNRHTRYDVYQTRKGKLALYIRVRPDWAEWDNPEAWSHHHHWGDPKGEAQRKPGKGWDVDIDVNVDTPGTRQPEWSYRHWRGKNWDWSQWPSKGSEYRLEVYESLDELQGHVPQELYEAVSQALQVGPDGSEFLDI